MLQSIFNTFYDCNCYSKYYIKFDRTFPTKAIKVISNIKSEMNRNY